MRLLSDKVKEWVAPTPKPKEVSVNMRSLPKDKTEIELAILVPTEARNIIIDLVSKGYTMPELLFILSRAYGEVTGSAKAFALPVEEIENSFFELCKKERNSKEVTMSSQARQ